jgi:proteasome activator subunit 4
MLSEFTPMITQDVCGVTPSRIGRTDNLLQNILTMIPVMMAFLPPTHIDLYMPLLFRLWEAFNSSVIDDRLLELCGELSEEHVSGKYSDAEEERGAEWKDIGIWTEAEWTVLVSKALGSMSKFYSSCPFAYRSLTRCAIYADVPVGSVRVSRAMLFTIAHVLRSCEQGC